MDNKKYPWHSAHTEELTEKNRARYSELRKQSLCVLCGVNPASVKYREATAELQ